MSRPDEIDASPAELALIDLLYGELEGPAEAEARKAVDAAPELTAAESDYRDLRALMSELPDEDPPAAITAQLLHAAAAKAPAAVPIGDGGGFLAWFKNFFRPLVMHPAMAAAATFILVAGVAGTLYLSGDVEVAQPPAADSPALAPPVEEAEKPGEATSADPAAADVDLPSSRFDDDIVVDGTMARPEPAVANERAKAPLPKAKSKAKNKAGKVRKRPAMKSPAPDPARDINTLGATGGDYLGKESGGGSVTKKPSPRKPAPKKQPAEPDVTGSAGQVISVDSKPPPLKSMDDEAEAERESKEQRAAAASWHRKAVQAAADGECDAVIAIGRRIRKLDSRYYDTSYLGDKRLSACLRPGKK